MSRVEVVVVFGGSSGERRVSVASAQHVMAVLPEATAWFVAPDGPVFDVAAEPLSRHVRAFERDFVPSSAPSHPNLDAALDASRGRERVFVLGFHGGRGEDGSVQRELESRGLAFTGSGSRASALAFDKSAAKSVVATAGITVADAVVLPPGDERRASDALHTLLAKHGRVVAKPVADGSSVGLHHVRARDQIPATAASIAASGVTYLAEAFVEGTELTVGVVDMGDGPRALCASEVRLDPGRAFDYEGKYLGRGTVELTPAQVAPEIAQAACEVALECHRALGCEGYSRTDVIAGARGPVFLETNTLPGLTRASFIPQQLAHANISMRTFLDAQITLARARPRDR